MTQAFQAYQLKRRRHWDQVAARLENWRSLGRFYQRRLRQVYRYLVPPGQAVLELGCGEGALLAGLKPALGVGVDFSGGMLRRAKRIHPGLTFVQADVHELNVVGQFDYIVMSDLANDLWDVQAVLELLARNTHPRTRIIFNTYSRLWELPLYAAQRMGWATATLAQNWLTLEDMTNLLRLAGFECVRTWQEVLLPVPLPLLDAMSNWYLVKVWPFSLLALANFIVARPVPSSRNTEDCLPSVSVVVPARNEAGNIPELFSRLPSMGSQTEVVFVEGNSRDNTYEVIQQEIANHPDLRCLLFKQQGAGKADAVRLGFAKAKGDILLILDADQTVPPESLPRFYEALRSREADLVNGVRLVYPMDDRAMRFVNLIGNKLFCVVFSWLLGQPVKDTLCGTKGLWKADYERIAANRDYFGDFDPFGDFDLLFGAARLSFRIRDIPIRYGERLYGVTNIDRWRDGWLLARMTYVAARRLKFVRAPPRLSRVSRQSCWAIRFLWAASSTTLRPLNFTGKSSTATSSCARYTLTGTALSQPIFPPGQAASWSSALAQAT
jgi:glycosyltransferase involved in cell wall biosynthesis/ubiquinone/menaquinone biosynthesis C-methylase UbiE